MKKRLLFLMLAIIIISNSIIIQGTEIKGTIYDLNLDIVKETKITINTQPKQMMITKDGNYNFNAPNGNYIIIAQNKDQIAVENITIQTEGLFNLDLILLPEFDEELLEELDMDIEDYEYFEESDAGKEVDMFFLIVIFILAVVFLICAAKYIRKKTKKEQKKDFKEDSEEVLDFLKKEGGRALQKDIRKHMAVSEAKISLLIDELCAKGKVKKIKKGRGNIIILK